MNAREKFLAELAFENGAHSLKAEFGYWTTTVKRFLAEGMPRVQEIPAALSDNGTISGADSVDPGSTFSDRNVRAACHLESYAAKFPSNFSPLFKVEIIEEDEEFKVYRDEYGITKKTRKTGSTPPLDLSHPVRNRADFEAYKEHYNRDFTRRLPARWEETSSQLAARDYPIRLGGFPYGFFGLPRHLMGVEGVFYAMFDDPQLIKDINEFFLGFAFDYWSAIIPKIKPDCVMIWEDMAYSSGSMISADAFREFLSPCYRKMVAFLKQQGVKNILVDSDGYVEGLIPLWVELGVTGLFPMERKAGNDLLRIREQLPRLQLFGGVDKRILAVEKGTRDIDAELEIARQLLAQGGFIPHVDHHVSDDACWKNFMYYRERLNRIIDETEC